MAESLPPLLNVELGFIEENDNWKLTSKYFPSKVGGKPSWLNLKHLPPSSEILCHNCKEPCVFLLQVYAPIDYDESCFHRTIFVFICKDSSCNKTNASDNIRVLRCQLPRKNNSYNFDPYPEDEEDRKPSAQEFNKLCCVCNCLGPLRCSQCHKVHYCSQAHQLIDWKAGHKEECQNKQETSKGWKKFLLPEFEIVMEAEPNEENPKPKKSEEEIMEDYQSFLKTDKAQQMLPESAESTQTLEELAGKEDEPFKKFLEKIRREPEQILRYQRGGQPLWVSSEHVPANDISDCPCGAKRQFEFQIMPQLLNYLHLDSLQQSIDWGTLAIYTCSNNCNENAAYHPEVVWKQDFSGK